MRRFWKRDDAELERRLTGARHEPREEFLDDLVRRVEASAPAEPRSVRVRRGAPRFALAATVSIVMVVMLAAFGGVGYAKSASSQAVKATSHSFTSVFSQGKNGKKGGKDGDQKSGHSNHVASHHVYPQPGFWCATKGSKVRVKLILLQERYDRLIERGFVIGPGPYYSRHAAKLHCLTAADGHEDDDD